MHEHADHVRSMISRLDASKSPNEPMLRTVIGQVEEIATQLLGTSEADADLKAEIIAWVIRFRQEHGMLGKAQSNVLFRSAPQRAEPSKTPTTRRFDYDTSDPRTQDPTFAEKRAGRRRPAENKPYTFGADPQSKAFTEKLDKLRTDINDHTHTPGSQESTHLLNRVLDLHKIYKAQVHWKYYDRVGDELDSMALRLSGDNVGRIIEKSRNPRLHKGVPAEIGPIFSRQVVSGGLPTLGRGR